MARADNFVGAKVEHLSFHRDALLFGFSKTKIDQEGINHTDQSWHVYGNSLEAVVCPLLALVWYVFAHPSILTGRINAFEGNSQY